LRRGVYALAPPFHKVRPHSFLVANHVVRGSYVSCQSALAHYGLIPEHVPVTISITAARPARWDTPLGVYRFHHVKLGMLRGYRLIEVSPGQRAFVASSEKALLDLIYLQPGGDSPQYLQELRLQNLDRLNLDELEQQAGLAHSPKLSRAATRVADLARLESQEYEVL
jgi:predicted transcriptional regulator of viral defense system